MSIFKCKMCGGTIEFEPGASVGVCEYCGSKQTLPRLDDDRRANLYDRANHFRRNNEFDKAAGIYEQILNEDTSDAEAYWSLVLCRYGIEYVEDPTTRKRVPTVNRAQFTSIFDDDNYKSALQYADGFQRSIYQEEAAAINELQKGILAISQKEEPFDVFICYKETDNSGRRTRDSVLANDLYHQLTQEGFKVFFSRITLEDKLGTAYEPYIFAALNSAKVMVVLGTRPEYFNAVWVKNEWSRYLALVKQSGGKKVLIPAYRDMDPYDLPEEFSHLQAQDMSKLGFMQDLIRGIKKIVRADEPKPAAAPQQTVVREAAAAGGSNTNALLDRGAMALEDGEWDKASEFYDQVLNQDARNGSAFLGLCLAKARCANLEAFTAMQVKQYTSEAEQSLPACQPDTKGIEALSKKLAVPGYLSAEELRQPFAYPLNYQSREASARANRDKTFAALRADRNYTRAVQYADPALKLRLAEAEKQIAAACDRRIEQARIAAEAAKGDIRNGYQRHLEQAAETAKSRSRAALARREADYQSACELQSRAKTETDFVVAYNAFQPVLGYKDADERRQACKNEAVRLREEADLQRKEAEARAKREAERRAKKKKRIALIALIAVLAAALMIAALIVVTEVIIPNSKYNEAVKLYEAGKYEEAITAFEALDGYKDSEDKIKLCKYDQAIKLYEAGKYEEAIAAFEALDGYKDSAEKLSEIRHSPEWLKLCSVGESVCFGTYEQDNNNSNGKEEIEWVVLAKGSSRILVISKYALDCKPYNTTYTDVTWETCSLRKWLNHEFLNAAFTAEEQKRIPTVTVSADKNPSYNTSPGNATQDKVFLLSISEVNKYFKSDEARKCAPTDYEIAQRAYTSSSYYSGGKATCWWWLRSPGGDSNYAAYVFLGGSVHSIGSNVDYDSVAVRPALWIDLEP